MDDLITSITQDLTDRKDWSARQEMFYRMRNGGIRRGALPFKGASDLWYPLGDTMIEKQKPSYIQQMHGGENIANFVCRKTQDQELTTGITGWFDYELKEETNFEWEMIVGIDQMLESGFCPVKAWWDAEEKRVCVEAVDPLHLIVPKTTQDINRNGGADRIAHVLHMSVDEYEANKQFTQGDDLVKRIKGKGQKEIDEGGKESSTNYIEGINCSANENEIVLWEVYEKDRETKKITVKTISPLLGKDENEVRKPFTLPYNKGYFASGTHFPFFKLQREIKGKGWYSSRGLIQINAPFESSLTANWNNIHDHLAFSARPNYENTGASALPQANNFRPNPGAILPAGLKMAVHPSPPPALREDMEMTRAIAEDRTQVPNLGPAEHLSGKPSVSGGVTATQVNAIVGQSSQGTDMAARIFRMGMADGLQIIWSLYLQYKMDGETLQYLSGSDVKTVDAAALHDGYDITPNGSGDSWNKGALVAKRMAYIQQWQAMNFMYVKQGEAIKWWMEADDPQMVKRLYEDPQVQAADQAEDQAYECLLIASGTSPRVQKEDDDKTHIQILGQWSADKIQRVEMTPEMAGMALKHGSEHMQQLQMKKDPAAQQIMQQMQPLIQMLQHIASQPGPPPKNILPMQTNVQQPQIDQSQPQVQPDAMQAAAPM